MGWAWGATSSGYWSGWQRNSEGFSFTRQGKVEARSWAAPRRCGGVDTYGGKVRLRWDPTAAVTAYGQMPYFIEFLKTAGLFEQ